MFSREESKEIRKQFWIFFSKRYPRKWLLYNTGVKDLTLKFYFDNEKAQVTINSESNSKIDRLYYFDKILSLKQLIKDDISKDFIFNDRYVLESSKVISTAYIQLDNVNIHNKNHWPKVFDFFYDYMSKLEHLYLEYQDFLKD